MVCGESLFLLFIMSCTRQTHDVDRVFNVGLMLVWRLRSCSNVDPTLVKCVVFAGYITYLVNVVPVHVHLYVNSCRHAQFA